VRDFAGKVAVVTGAASGVGLALARSLGGEAAKVVLADVEKGALDSAVAELSRAGHEATGVVTDVTRYAGVTHLADTVFERHGAVHLLFNNAGVGLDETTTPIWAAEENDWRWALGVNVWGVIHGMRAFVPRMLERGEEGHVVNTSSGNGGLVPLPNTPIYSTTKAAVTTMTEVLHYQLQAAGGKIRASVLFPGPHIVNTNIFGAARNRPAALAPEHGPDRPPPTLEELRGMMEQAGIAFAVTEPAEVAESTLEALREDRFWILPPSPAQDARIRERVESILARRNPVLGKP
jgi:NAD(P)-dependent dehydrogenase (short-subunit alcohol dehydrogenase family)